MFSYLGGLLLGWGLGANDSANVFGTAVSARMVRYRTAVILIAVFVVLGALYQGAEGIETLSAISEQTQKTASICSLAAAVTVAFMTLLKLPVSTSQAVVGAIVAVGLLHSRVNGHLIAKIAVCWVGTPIGGMIFSFLLYYLFRFIVRRARLTLFALDGWLRAGLIVCGAYGAYALGANNVANVAAVFVGSGPGMLEPGTAALVGGLSIAVGALTYSRQVMMTVGKGIIQLDAFSAFICVLAHALTVHVYAMLGVPVSTSQAIVGAIMGISLIKGLHVINYPIFFRVLMGWIGSPLIAGLVAALLYRLFGG